MRRIVGTLALLSGLVLGQLPLSRSEAAEAPPAKLTDLSWLTGHWSGGDGSSRWEAVYSSPSAGTLVGASKEMRGDKTLTTDFEVFRQDEDTITMTPFPFGKRSKDFPLVELDPEAKLAVFENPAHDFPRRFTYRLGPEGQLQIALEGEPNGQKLRIELELERVN